MKNAIILHGSTDREEYYSLKHPSMSNSHWLPWLQKQLLVKDISAVTPEVPRCFQLDYATWKREFERFDITPETILVGHSCGGGFLVRWLSENKDRTVGKVVLVAPWLDPHTNSTPAHTEHERRAPPMELNRSRVGVRVDPSNEKDGQNDFFNFEIDSELVSRTKGVTIFNSDDDMKSVLKSVEILREKIKDIEYREFKEYGHFCIGDLKTNEFPELLEEVLKEK